MVLNEKLRAVINHQILNYYYSTLDNFRMF
jgi:hypothetical protein